MQLSMDTAYAVYAVSIDKETEFVLFFIYTSPTSTTYQIPTPTR